MAREMVAPGARVKKTGAYVPIGSTTDDDVEEFERGEVAPATPHGEAWVRLDTKPLRAIV